MRAKRTDANHREIRDALRQCGWRVYDVHTVPGFVDMVAQRGLDTRLIEVKKATGKVHYTPDQLKLRMGGWETYLLRSVDDAINLR